VVALAGTSGVIGGLGVVEGACSTAGEGVAVGRGVGGSAVLEPRTAMLALFTGWNVAADVSGEADATCRQASSQ